MAINLVQVFRTKRHPKHKLGAAAPIGLYPDAKFLVIQIPDYRTLILLSRSLILALCIVSLPWLNSLLPTATTSSPDIISSDAIVTVNLRLWPLIFRDLANDGLYKRGAHKAVFVSNGDEEALKRSQILDNDDTNEVELIDSEKQDSVPDNSVDFAFVSAFPAASKFIARTLKIGGIVALQLSDNPSDSFKKPENYKMVYLRQFDTTVLAMRKTSQASETTSSNTSPTSRRLLAEKAKKEALKHLEDVLLEPPRASSLRSRRYLKRTRYLPDLMGDSLEGYPRRVFIDVGLPEKEGGSGTSWFAKNYPTRKRNFEMYKIETLTEESSGKEVVQTGMSEWLNKNVKEEEYVVMKAEAEVVEEMMKSKAIKLVDELFLECTPQGHNGKKGDNNSNHLRSRRAYWQCLALYGQLRDQGVAVHQWWG